LLTAIIIIIAKQNITSIPKERLSIDVNH